MRVALPDEVVEEIVRAADPETCKNVALASRRLRISARRTVTKLKIDCLAQFRFARTLPSLRSLEAEWRHVWWVDAAPKLGKLTGLTELTIQTNISYIDGISALTNLEALRLKTYIGRQAISWEDLTLLTKLKELGLSYMRGPMPDSVSNLARLTSLSVRFGLEMFDDNDNLTSLTNLVKLSICDSTDGLPLGVSRLTGLKSLALCTVTELGPLALLTQLTHLRISDGRLVGVLPEVPRLVALEALDLSGNLDIEDGASFVQLTALTKLTALVLDSAVLPLVPEAVTTLTGLKLLGPPDG